MRASTAVATTEPVPEKKFIETSYIDFDENKTITVLDNDKVPLPSPFCGPERDLVNFPKPVRLENVSPCRHLFFPEGWFKFLYPKLGVSGEKNVNTKTVHCVDKILFVISLFSRCIYFGIGCGYIVGQQRTLSYQ